MFHLRVETYLQVHFLSLLMSVYFSKYVSGDKRLLLFLHRFQQNQQNRNPNNSGGFDRPSSVPRPFPGGRSTATQSGPSGLYGLPDQGQSGSFGRSDQGQLGSFGRHDQDQFFSPQKGDQPWGQADTPSKAYSNRPSNAGGYQVIRSVLVDMSAANNHLFWLLRTKILMLIDADVW